MVDQTRFTRKPKPIPEGRVEIPGSKAKREKMAAVKWQMELRDRDKFKAKLAPETKPKPATLPPRLNVAAWRAETYARLASMFRSIKGPLDQERVNRVRNRPTP
jgi:hypothetical protein